MKNGSDVRFSDFAARASKLALELKYITRTQAYLFRHNHLLSQFSSYTQHSAYYSGPIKYVQSSIITRAAIYFAPCSTAGRHVYCGTSVGCSSEGTFDGLFVTAARSASQLFEKKKRKCSRHFQIWV
jgi:hypothetical protein